METATGRVRNTTQISEVVANWAKAAMSQATWARDVAIATHAPLIAELVAAGVSRTFATQLAGEADELIRKHVAALGEVHDTAANLAGHLDMVTARYRDAGRHRASAGVPLR